MKVELDEKGTLKIIAENGLESYALQKWSKEFFCDVKEAKSVLLISTRIGEEQKGH